MHNNLGMAYALTKRSNLTANLRTDVSGDSGSTLSLGMTTKLGKLPPLYHSSIEHIKNEAILIIK